MATYNWEFYQDSKKEWRWNKKSAQNGQIVAASSEGFASRHNAVENAKKSGYTGS